MNDKPCNTHGHAALSTGQPKGRRRVLTPDQVTTLRARIAAGERKTALARELAISRGALYQYLNNERPAA